LLPDFPHRQDDLVQHLGGQARELLAEAAARFGCVDAAAVSALERDAEWIQLRRGDVLVRQGDDGDRAFVLLAGRLQATRQRDDGSSAVIGDVAAGETVGEMALFTGERRTATVRAVRDSVLLALSRTAIERLLAADPAAVRHVMQVQIARVQRANEGKSLRAPVTNIAVVPLDDHVDSGDFCRRLSSALAAVGTVEHLNAERIDAHLQHPGLADAPEDGADAARLAAWLNEVERRARFVVHETVARHPGWVARSASRADLVVLVGRAGGDPALSAIERLVAQQEGDCPAPRLLVLLHEGNALPSGTAAWLGRRTIARHLHVRRSQPNEIGRVARFIAGRAVGVVLGAGGARGFAHIGLLRALQEERIAIDMVGGTSMGAAIAAQHAMGWTPERIADTADEVWNRLRPHKEYTLPLLSVIRGRRSRQCGETMYGDVRIEDLWVPFFCVSSDLTNASMFVHRSGSLLDAITASSSPPVVSVPTCVDGHLLSDGSLFNTLPVDLAREDGCGVIIASRVSVPQDKDFLFDSVPTLGQVIRSKLTRRPLRYPGVMSVLLRSSMIAAVGRENLEAQHADYLLVPPVERYGLMEFTALREIVEAGYTFAARQIQAWRAAGRLEPLPREGD
jgi:predicted acylesterase/phospholipase RssA/CRP-like cAMP-binding protein